MRAVSDHHGPDPARLTRFQPALRPSAYTALVMLILALVNAGCATAPPLRDEAPTNALEATAEIAVRHPPPVAETALFGPRPELPSFEDMLLLTEDQRSEFLDFFKSPQRTNRSGHRRLVEYLEQRLKPVRFHDVTLGARDALLQGQGNCMSLTLLTTSLARMVDVRIEWRLNRSRPVYSAEGAVIYSSNHIQTRLFNPLIEVTPGQITLASRVLVVDFFTNGMSIPGRRIKENELAGLVFQNLAAEALADGDLNRAFWLVQAGLEHNPRNSDFYNVLGVLHRRVGALAKAEEFYRFALREFGDELVILRNLYYQLLSRKRTDDAVAIEQRIAQLP
ncbi:MAG: hypothetical protein ACPGJE_07645, partial [Wenzhouxiangellaceae bacterium]